MADHRCGGACRSVIGIGGAPELTRACLTLANLARACPSISKEDQETDCDFIKVLSKFAGPCQSLPDLAQAKSDQETDSKVVIHNSDHQETDQ